MTSIYPKAASSTVGDRMLCNVPVSGVGCWGTDVTAALIVTPGQEELRRSEQEAVLRGERSHNKQSDFEEVGHAPGLSVDFCV